jgi:site-specific recombinase XerD
MSSVAAGGAGFLRFSMISLQIIYFDAINSLQLAQGPAQSYRSEAEHVAAWLRIKRRRRWADIDDTIIDQYAVHDCRCPVWRKRGKLVTTGTKRRRRGARHFVEFLRGRGVIPSVEPVVG